MAPAEYHHHHLVGDELRDELKWLKAGLRDRDWIEVVSLMTALWLVIGSVLSIAWVALDVI